MYSTLTVRSVCFAKGAGERTIVFARPERCSILGVCGLFSWLGCSGKGGEESSSGGEGFVGDVIGWVKRGETGSWGKAVGEGEGEAPAEAGGG